MAISNKQHKQVKQLSEKILKEWRKGTPLFDLWRRNISIASSSDLSVATALKDVIRSKIKMCLDPKVKNLDILKAKAARRESFYMAATNNKIKARQAMLRYREQAKHTSSIKGVARLHLLEATAMSNVEFFRKKETKHWGILKRYIKEQNRLIAAMQPLIEDLTTIGKIEEWNKEHGRIALDYAVENDLTGRWPVKLMHERRFELWLEDAETKEARKADNEKEFVVTFIPDKVLRMQNRRDRQNRLTTLGISEEIEIIKTDTNSDELLNALWSWERRFKYNEPARIAPMVTEVRYAKGRLYILVDASKFLRPTDVNVGTVGIAMNIDYDMMLIDMNAQVMPEGKVLFDRTQQPTPLFRMTEPMLDRCPEELRVRRELKAKREKARKCRR